MNTADHPATRWSGDVGAGSGHPGGPARCRAAMRYGVNWHIGGALHTRCHFEPGHPTTLHVGPGELVGEEVAWASDDRRGYETDRDGATAWEVAATSSSQVLRSGTDPSPGKAGGDAQTPVADASLTYWNGEPTPAARCVVMVGTPLRPSWWCAELKGQKRDAVRVEYGGQVFYLDDDDGSGWAKVTAGRGSPQVGHRGLPDDSVVLWERSPGA